MTFGVPVADAGGLRTEMPVDQSLGRRSRIRFRETGTESAVRDVGREVQEKRAVVILLDEPSHSRVKLF